MDAYQNDHGFTLLSTLLALGIIVMTLPFVISLLNMVNMDDNHEALSVRRYFSYMRDEAIEADKWSATEGELNMTLPSGEKMVFKQHGQLIIRQLNNGHETYLRHVDHVQFKALSYGVRIQITTMQGENYAKTITFY